MNADSLNAIGTAVIALTTSIGVLSTLVYYLANIKEIHIPIIILTSFVYILIVLLSIKYLKRGLNNA